MIKENNVTKVVKPMPIRIPHTRDISSMRYLCNMISGELMYNYYIPFIEVKMDKNGTIKLHDSLSNRVLAEYKIPDGGINYVFDTIHSLANEQVTRELMDDILYSLNSNNTLYLSDKSTSSEINQKVEDLFKDYMDFNNLDKKLFPIIEDQSQVTEVIERIMSEITIMNCADNNAIRRAILDKIIMRFDVTILDCMNASSNYIASNMPLYGIIPIYGNGEIDKYLERMRILNSSAKTFKLAQWEINNG